MDFISGTDPSYNNEILDNQGLLNEKYQNIVNFESYPFLNTEYLGFLMDSDSEFSKNKNLRKSIYYANRQRKMLKYLRNNIGIPANHGFLPVGLPNFSKDIINGHYNLNLAKKYLELVDSQKEED